MPRFSPFCSKTAGVDVLVFVATFVSACGLNHWLAMATGFRIVETIESQYCCNECSSMLNQSFTIDAQTIPAQCPTTVHPARGCPSLIRIC
jgi:hypothetical protein